MSLGAGGSEEFESDIRYHGWMGIFLGESIAYGKIYRIL